MVKSIYKILSSFVIVSGMISMAGCTPVTPAPAPTATVTATSTAITLPTQTPVPSATITLTPEPTATATLLPLPTNSVSSQSALSMSGECRAVIDGLYNLKKDLKFPDHFTTENPFRRASDFDPNTYFKVLTHLKLTSGYKLDYVYFNDELGGLPLVYARKSNSAPFKSYSALLKSFGEEVSDERSYGELNHKYDYLEKIQIDKEPESYFEFVTLAFLGDQFYLWWHGGYNDAKILCDPGDMQYVDADMKGFNVEFPQEVKDKIEQIDFTPMMIVDEDKVTVRYVVFTKWGGFAENVYVMDKNDPMQLLDVQFNPLIEYHCGIDF